MVASRSLADADVIIYGADAGHMLGEAITGGDVNRDTPNDLVFLAPGAGPAGELHVVYGRSSNAFGSVMDLAVVGASRRIIGDPGAGPITSVQVYEVTGEGARDIIAGVSSVNGDTGAVYFAISPKMRTAPTAITATLQQGQAAVVDVEVLNASPISITWSAGANRPWITPLTSSGSAVIDSNGLLPVRLSSAGLPVGTHTGTLSVHSTSSHLRMSRHLNVSLTVTAPPPPEPGSETARNDFNGDGKMDLLWQNRSDGYLAVWSLDGPSLLSSDLLSPNRVADTAWRIAGTGDFNGDGKPDIVWHDQRDGWIGIWLMDGMTLLSSTSLSPSTRWRVADTNWKIVGVLDLNGDHKPDILWQEQTQGWLVAWLVDGLTVTASVDLTPNRVADTNWKVVATGDLNNDGQLDIIWQHATRGWLAAWLMNGLTVTDSVLLSPNRVTDPSWRIVAAGDVNGNGKTDLVWQDNSAGWLVVWLMDGTSLVASVDLTPNRVSDTNWKIVGPR